jgi:tRNA A58 N-methylase Trm61
LITVECRDVCAKVDHYGGGFGNLLDNSIDAVFLDLPEPWLVIPYAKRVLKPGSSICTYSPCIEQVILRWKLLNAVVQLLASKYKKILCLLNYLGCANCRRIPQSRFPFN